MRSCSCRSYEQDLINSLSLDTDYVQEGKSSFTFGVIEFFWSGIKENFNPRNISTETKMLHGILKKNGFRFSFFGQLIPGPKEFFHFYLFSKLCNRVSAFYFYNRKTFSKTEMSCILETYLI